MSERSHRRPRTRLTVRVALLAGAILGAMWPTVVAAGSPNEATPADLGDVIEAVRNRFNAPAVAAAVTRDGCLVAVGARGVRDLTGNKPVTTTDRTLIGSCGKSLTRLLIGRLVDRKLLRWDSTIGELLPDVAMRDEYRNVTVGDIIGHNGGLQPYTRISPTHTHRSCSVSRAAHESSEPPSSPISCPSLPPRRPKRDSSIPMLDTDFSGTSPSDLATSPSSD